MQDALFGRLALHQKWITTEQLVEAVTEQGRATNRRRIGEILVEKGYLTEPQVQQILVLQQRVLAKKNAEVAGGASSAPSVSARAAPPKDAKTASAAASGTASPGNGAARRTTPVSHLTAATGPARDAPTTTELTDDIRAHARAAGDAKAARGEPAGWLRQFLETAVRGGASDIHVHSGARLRVRYLGKLLEMGEHPVSPDDAEALLLPLLTERERAELHERGELDFSYTLSGVGRFRANMYRQQHGLDCVLRVIPESPPSLADLGLPSSLARLTTYHQGIVLVTGPSGCGKTSTLAALVDIINAERRDHILTIEDPVEVVHPSKRCIVNQRQVKRHTQSFARALKGALREDPDIIVIGEMRDHETISLALTAAETGHLVLSTLHTNSAIRTINRLVGVFPPNQQGQVRAMISESLRAIVSQRLVPRADGQGRVPALEVLYVTPAVGNLIRENRTLQIRSVLQTGMAHGMRALDHSLAELVSQGVVTPEAAARNAEDPKRFSAPPTKDPAWPGSTSSSAI